MSKLSVSQNGQWTLQNDVPSMEDFAKSYVTDYRQEDLNKSQEASLFRRYEDKYIIPNTLKAELDKVLAKHLNPDYLEKKTKYNSMKSVYFDSANLDTIRHHLSKATSRFKIRTREYAPNGEFSKSDFTYLEVKAKHGDVTDKFRIKVPNDDIEGFKKGLPLIPTLKLIKANQHIGVADLVKRVQDINSAAQTFSMRPSCEVTYDRHAYSDGNSDGLRVTYDNGVKYNLLNHASHGVGNALVKGDSDIGDMMNGYNPDAHLILEVKHHGNVPDWLNTFLNDHKIVKTSFSKYCYSMASACK